MKRPLPEHPPEQWHWHPAWLAHAYEPLVAFHDRYRRETSRLVADAQDSTVSIAALQETWKELAEFLRNHEAVEESALYPWIEKRFDVELTRLREQHGDLNDRLDDVIALLAKVGRNRAAFRAASVELDQFLRDHLAAEEAICVPALLDASRDELATLLGSPHETFFALLFAGQAAIADAPLKTRLGLDMDQAKAVDEIQATYRADFRAKRGVYQKEQRELRRAKSANDSALVAQQEPVVAGLKAELREIILSTDDKVRALLTPEQLEKFEEYIVERNSMVGSSRDVRVLEP